MISKETAASIWKCYDEIEKAQNLLSEMSERMKRGEDPNPRDAFGRQQNLKLGVPSGENSHQLYDVRPRLALSIIRAHVAEKERELVEACERARIELGQQDATITTGYFCNGCEVSCRLDTGGKPFDLTEAYCYQDGNKTGVNWNRIPKSV